MLMYAFYTQGLIPTDKIWYIKACLLAEVDLWKAVRMTVSGQSVKSP